MMSYAQNTMVAYGVELNNNGENTKSVTTSISNSGASSIMRGNANESCIRKS